MKVSVIVPVYNVEAYLPDCLKSIEEQTYTDFELVLVDDGSTDHSGNICDKYSATHDNVIVIHQKNQGLSAARNNGVKISAGDYITFIDSDDYVSNNYLSYLVDQIRKTSADISVGKSLIVFDTKKYISVSHNEHYKVYSAEDALIRMMYEKEFICTAWGKLYRRDLIEKYPYPIGVLYEDLATTYKIFGDAKKVSVGSQYIYFWRHRKNSISKQIITDRHIRSLEFAQAQIDYMKEKYPNAVSAAKYKYVAKIVSLVPYTFSKDTKSKQYFHVLQKELEKYGEEVLKDKEARKDIKIRCVAIQKGYLPAKILIGATELIKPLRSKFLEKKEGLL